MLTFFDDVMTKAYVVTVAGFSRFKHDEKGVTAVEYAIVAAGVAAICTVIFGSSGPVKGMLNDIFVKISTTVQAMI
ncbi:TPA: Flp family type IVb pilin [Enterobacter hormaechei]